LPVKLNSAPRFHDSVISVIKTDKNELHSTIVKFFAFLGSTENAGHEIAGHVIDGPNCRAWKLKTRICKTWI